MENVSVLICEDEQIVAKDIKQSLTQRGYKVVGIANNGAKALEMAKEHMPDLALMDINLNGKIYGTLVAEALNEQLKIPSIFITAYADDETLEAAKRAQPLGYVLKPYKDQELYATIETGISRLRAQKKIIDEIKEKINTPLSLHKKNISTEKELVSDFLNSQSANSLRSVIANVVDHISGDLLVVEQQTKRIATLNDSSIEIMRACRTSLLHQEYLKNFIQKLFEISDRDVTSQEEICFVKEALEKSMREFSEPKIKTINFNIETRQFDKMKVFASSDELTKSLINIFSNAFEASSNEAIVDIDITADCIHEPEFWNPNARAGMFCCITIKDYGVGITEEELSIIRQPLYSNWGDSLTNLRFGVGLSYVENFVQKYGGWMTIESSPYIGTTVQLYLPKLS